MRRLRLVGLLLAVCLLLNTAVPVQAATPAAGQVGVVLFWMQGCAHCEDVLQQTLPPLQTRYGENLNVQLVEVAGIEGVDQLYRVGAAYGLAKEQTGVPLLIIGEQVLVGSEQIPAELPALIERYLAAGGVQTVVRQEAPAVAEVQAVPAAAEVNQDDGMWLAWLTMALMGLGLLAVIVLMLLALQGRAVLALPAWAEWLIPLLSLAGIFAAAYLTFIEAFKAQAICGPVGDCNAVQNSPYAFLFGVIPVGLLGLLGYLAIVGVWAWQRRNRQALWGMAPVAMFGMAVFGTLFSVYLTYLELFVIHAVCIWCISSAWIITLLMLLAAPQAANWLRAADESED